MQHNSDDRRLASGWLLPRHSAAIVARARELGQSARIGRAAPTLLLGRNLGLLGIGADTESAALFHRAALALGARVAELRCDLTEHSSALEVERTARTLGQLYDAVECQGMPEALVRDLRTHAGIPIFDAIAAPGHPSAALAELLDADASPADRRQLVLQAVLLATIG